MIHDQSGHVPNDEYDRPRCPRCGALVSLRVSGVRIGPMAGGDGLAGFGMQGAARAATGMYARISTPCAYRVRGTGGRDPCGQPIVIVLSPQTPSTPVRYAFPPDWPTANTLSDNELIDRYGW